MIVLTSEEFEELTNFVKVNYGINLEGKKIFAEIRLQRLMEESGYETFTQYFDYVINDFTGTAITSFISCLTVNHTLFYRESSHFKYLSEEVLPYWVNREANNRSLNVWSAGCSTGEEPYTLAMIISDYLGLNKSLWDMRILATDISMFALKKATDGIYPAESILGLNPNWTKNYFTQTGDSQSVGIAKSIKEQVIFRKLNLICDSFNFKRKFHIIFCRNVMIYFDQPTKNALVERFYHCLEDGGYLFIGLSETIDKEKTKFKYIMPSIYRKGDQV